MRIYLAGPMSGLEDFNFPAFFEAEKFLKEQGYDEVFNPARADLDKYGDLETINKEANYRDCLRVDLNWILDNADAIAVLPGWENSKGVKAELALAKALGLFEIYLD